VNVASEQNKFGLAPQISVLTELFEKLRRVDAIKIAGLMCMARTGYCRAHFAAGFSVHCAN